MAHCFPHGVPRECSRWCCRSLDPETNAHPLNKVAHIPFEFAFELVQVPMLTLKQRGLKVGPAQGGLCVSQFTLSEHTVTTACVSASADVGRVSFSMFPTGKGAYMSCISEWELWRVGVKKTQLGWMIPCSCPSLVISVCLHGLGDMYAGHKRRNVLGLSLMPSSL